MAGSNAGPKTYILPVTLVSLVVAWLAIVVAARGAWLDAEVLTRLLAIFAVQGKSEAGAAPIAIALPLPVQAGTTFLFALGATWCGFRLAAVPRLLVSVQLFVLSLLSVVGLRCWLGGGAHPLAYFAAVFLGCLCGYGLRVVDLKRRKQESQHYELLLRNKELQETKLQLVKQDEIERRMLAADLHDQVLNDLKAVRQKLDAYESAPDPAVAEAIRGLLSQAMDEIREVMDSLCPSALEHLGLVAALEDCLRRGAARAGFKTRFKTRLGGRETGALSMVEQSLLYRLFQESVTNVCKHAGATLVRASVTVEDDELVIRVADNGRGIDQSRLREDSRGVRYMRQRADLIGATIAWRPGEEGKGTTVEIRLSLSGREDGQGSCS